MAVPTAVEYSLIAVETAHTALVTLLDAGSSNANILIRDSADVLLGSVPLDDPCGTVSGVTGQLTFAIVARDESADASGTAAYAEFADSDGNVHLALPTIQGAVAVPGYLTLNTRTIVAGGPIEIFSATIG